MIKIIEEEQLDPSFFAPRLQSQQDNVVASIIADVRSRGDAALREYTASFDKLELQSFQIPADEVMRITRLYCTTSYPNGTNSQTWCPDYLHKKR